MSLQEPSNHVFLFSEEIEDIDEVSHQALENKLQYYYEVENQSIALIEDQLLQNETNYVMYMVGMIKIEDGYQYAMIDNEDIGLVLAMFTNPELIRSLEFDGYVYLSLQEILKLCLENEEIQGVAINPFGKYDYIILNERFDNLDNAITRYKEAIEIATDASVSYEDGNFEEAYELYLSAAAYDLPLAKAWLGYLSMNGIGTKKDVPLALDYVLDAILEEEPFAYCVLGDIYLTQNKYRLAIRAYQKALALQEITRDFEPIIVHRIAKYCKDDYAPKEIYQLVHLAAGYIREEGSFGNHYQMQLLNELEDILEELTTPSN